MATTTMEAVRKIVSADALSPVIDLPWYSKGLQVEVIVFPINNVTLSNEEKNDFSFGGWAEIDKTTEDICSEIRASRTFSLTEGYGIWADDAPFDENNFRDKLWQTEKNVW